jgi:hypothetical protein
VLWDGAASLPRTWVFRVRRFELRRKPASRCWQPAGDPDRKHQPCRRLLSRAWISLLQLCYWCLGSRGRLEVVKRCSCTCTGRELVSGRPGAGQSAVQRQKNYVKSSRNNCNEVNWGRCVSAGACLLTRRWHSILRRRRWPFRTLPLVSKHSRLSGCTTASLAMSVISGA